MKASTVVLLSALPVLACSKPHEGAAVVSPAPATPPERATPAPIPTLDDVGDVGHVDFKIDCDPAVQTKFERGVAMLHSFFYVGARLVFTEVTNKDPQCAMGYWGQAMTWYHPLWAAPTDEEFKAGKAAIQKAATLGKRSARDQALVDAVSAFYDAELAEASPSEPTGQSCHGPVGGHPALAKAYAAKMKAAYTQFPDDDEVAAFYALALLGAAPAIDPELKNQLAAADVLNKLWAKRKTHPGVAHYLIHAYDYPSLAPRALEAARLYASLAPAVPHAQHMPSHIFVRLGMWKEAVASNVAAAAASVAYASKTNPDTVLTEELHALDYMVYSYLQMADDAKAKAVSDRIPTIKKLFPTIDFVSSYALAAVPARYAVERHDWKMAAELTFNELPGWKVFPFTESIIEYARGLGRARSGDVAGAKRSLARMSELHDASTDPKFGYFRKHGELQSKAVSAWVLRAEGKNDAAVALMTEAAVAEDALGKHPVSPGPIYPIYEQLGELLLDVGRPAPALDAFQASLKTSPGRLNALIGAARAAHAAKKDTDARAYWDKIAAMTVTDGTRRDLAELRTLLQAK